MKNRLSTASISVVLLALLLSASQMVAQEKFLQLEKVSSLKVRRYYPGDGLTFQLNNGQWYTRVIEDVSYDSKLIVFADNLVHADSIVAIRSFNNQKWSRPIGNQLYNFAIAWATFALIAAVADNESPVNDVNILISASSAGLGFTIKKLFRLRTFHFRKNKYGAARKWRLRILDLRVQR